MAVVKCTTGTKGTTDFINSIQSRKPSNFPKFYQKILVNTLPNIKLPLSTTDFLWGVAYSNYPGYSDMYPEITVVGRITKLIPSFEHSLRKIARFGDMVREMEDPKYVSPFTPKESKEGKQPYDISLFDLAKDEEYMGECED